MESLPDDEAPIGGLYRGVFSYCYFKVLRAVAMRIARRRLDALVCAEVKKMGFSQIPQLKANSTELDQAILRELPAAAAHV